MFAICLELSLGGCRAPVGSVPRNPYMEDRTEGWTAVMPYSAYINLLDLGHSSSNSDLWIQILRTANEQPSFRTTILSEDDAAEAIKTLIWEHCGKVVSHSQIYIMQSIGKQYWIIQCVPYYAVFDLSGELIAFVDTTSCNFLCPIEQNNEAKSLIDSDNRFWLVYMFDLAQLTVDQLVEFSKAHIGLTYIHDEYLGDRFKTKSPTIEKVYNNAIEIANNKFSKYKYDDRFCVYTNHADDAWIVRCNVWTAVFSKQTGELVFLDVCRMTDMSYRIDS